MPLIKIKRTGSSWNPPNKILKPPNFTLKKVQTFNSPTLGIHNLKKHINKIHYNHMNPQLEF